MTRLLTSAALFAALALPAAAQNRHSGVGEQGFGQGAGTIVVSCYRGPWTDVIWDRPNPVFIDSLVAAGYEHPEALAIGERLCRDASLVNNPDAMKREAIRVLENAPSDRPTPTRYY
ncbi:hypothetical protein EKE94_14815 [Mesobaculum littorinae]|uniref:DUF732 domain-containing protein n=1 Tax=Mesobaculum littorinae TaxID=2486419 RepID=A0A438AEZ5_9RHOB|nr:hypothetical protein [Mesobaculum littorinae]RVV97281.1 hypothetical protein EKE94_14815 [Mesobaculum littorinae]